MTNLNIKFFIIFSLMFSAVSYAEVQIREANNGNLVMQDIPEIPQQVIDDLNQYQNVRSAPFRGFTEDGKSIFISTRFGDVSQIHRVDMAGGARNQLTFFKEPIGGVTKQPGSNKLSFTMDAGGSEYAQIFIFDPATGNSKMLTDGESRNGAVLWDKKGSKIAFQSTRRNGKSNDIWVMDPDDPNNAFTLLESPDGSWWGPSDWSKDNKKLLAQQYVSASDSRIYLVDTKTKEKIKIAGDPENNSTNFGLAFDSDGKGIFMITSQFSEFNQLAYQSLSGKSPEIITKDIPWNVSSFSISEDGGKAAFVVNQDGFNVLYLLDVSTFKFNKVEGLPIGLINGLEFDLSGNKLGFTLNTAQSPSDSFVLSLGDTPLSYSKLQRWTYSEVGGLDTQKFSKPELVRFKSFDDRQIPAFIYKPATKGPYPVVISIHGGPEGQFRPAFRSTFQLWMDKLGVAVIAPNVRGSAGYGKAYIGLDNGFKREDSVKDIGALLDWIETQPDLDKNRVAVFGGSYGGYMVLASATHYSDRLKAAVDIVGISNFVTFLENTKSYRRDLRRVEYGDERNPKMREFLNKISPINNVEKIKIPMFVIQGQNDPRVPVTEAEQIVKALRETKNQVWYMNALNEGHGYRKKENRDIYEQAVLLFFKQYLL